MCLLPMIDVLGGVAVPLILLLVLCSAIVPVPGDSEFVALLLGHNMLLWSLGGVFVDGPGLVLNGAPKPDLG